jgi:ABC-2 type transport system permease protein
MVDHMLKDDIRCLWAILRKDLRAYYFKPPNISWGILFPFAFVLAFMIRDGVMLNIEKAGALVPGLLALTLLFGTSSMEAIVITFERRIGALERLLLAPMRLPALLGAKLLGGMVFGLATTTVVMILLLAMTQPVNINWWLVLVTLVLSAAAFSAMGVLISVSVKEVFEAQTLANAFRFPMMFLGGVFVPVTSLPIWLAVIARTLPLTYAVEALRIALTEGQIGVALLDLLVLTAYTVVFFSISIRILAKRVS